MELLLRRPLNSDADINFTLASAGMILNYQKYVIIRSEINDFMYIMISFFELLLL